MKRILVLFLLACPFVGSVLAQAPKTFNIIPAEVTQVLKLEAALEKCSLDPYRMPRERARLIFKDGTVVELFSAKELSEAGISVSWDQVNRTGNANLSRFSLHPDGYILEETVNAYDKMEITGRRNESNPLGK